MKRKRSRVRTVHALCKTPVGLVSGRRKTARWRARSLHGFCRWMRTSARRRLYALKSRAPCATKAIPLRTQFCGRWVRHSGWTPDDVVQLFRRGQARFSEHAVHEHVRVEGRIGHLTQPLEHYSYRSQREVNEKVQRYARAGAQELHRAGIRGGFCKALLHGGWAWWRTFIWRLGFLDGWTGWAIAAMNARTAWLKYKYLGAARGAAPTSAAVRNS